MGHIFENFGVSDRAFIGEGIEQGSIAIKAAWDTIQDVRRNPGHGNYRYKTWFGAADRLRIKYVYEALSTMHYAVTSGNIRFHRMAGNAFRAEARPPQAGWANKSVRQILDSGQFVIDLYDPFFQPTREIQGAEYAPALTFVHELSHIVAETNEPIDTWPEVYGKWSCKRLAAHRPEHAIRNAENYGFFCVAHLQYIMAKRSLARLGVA